MSHSHEDDLLSEDLRRVADVLREGRPTLDPLSLDRVKVRAMSAARSSSSSRPKGFLMKQRLTTLIAAGLLTLGTGGTLALAGGGDGGGGGSASFHQYKPPCDKGKGKGGDHECHGHEGEETGKGGDHGGEPGGGGDKGGGDKGGKAGGDKGGGDKGGGDKGGHGHH